MNGSNFVAGSTVSFAGTNPATTFVSSSQLKAQITSADLALPPNQYVVEVVNPAPGGTSNQVTFVVFDAKITFESSRALDGSDAVIGSNAFNVWVVRQNASGLQALTNIQSFGDNQLDPVWSPDGSKIAFASFRALDGSDVFINNNPKNIWVVNADGTGVTPVTNLTASGASSFLPVWSPDGSKIAFQSIRALDGNDAAMSTIHRTSGW